jgi:hypothetical protein
LTSASAQKTIDILKKDRAPNESAIRNAQQIIDSSKQGSVASLPVHLAASRLWQKSETFGKEILRLTFR